MAFIANWFRRISARKLRTSVVGRTGEKSRKMLGIKLLRKLENKDTLDYVVLAITTMNLTLNIIRKSYLVMLIDLFSTIIFPFQ